MLTIDPDLSPEYIATLRRMTGQQKWRTAAGIYWSARKWKAAAFRQRHPDWTEDQVSQAVKEVFLHART